jgi:hypothetical protein
MTLLSSSTKLEKGTPLWRYMSLDKLIDLLATKELHFAPLASFAKSDPFEGYIPAVALEADASIFRPHVDDAELAWRLVQEHREAAEMQLTGEERARVESQIADLKTAPRQYHAAIAKSIAVNCWHINEGESETMWRLYGDGGKARPSTPILTGTICNR